ncbi:Sporulation kinase D [Stieleria varia]|uniref:histidine kinase n=1 Tax=Stieleria varia TaxID=2528005 RepID=A0A5C6A0D2_9BACT|nr:Sporulation kinase D [Stieleria varia]
MVVAVVSSRLGARWAQDDVDSRFAGIQAALQNAPFPLNQIVLDSLAKLTQTQLVTLGPSDRQLNSTTSGSGDEILDAENYIVHRFETTQGYARSDGVLSVAVLFDRRQVDATRRRAALLPLITGLSTILAISSLTLLLSTRLVGRLTKLQRRVEAVAGGDFQTAVSDQVTDHGPDEVGRLGQAVDAMAGQLGQLWKQVNRQQSEKLLHQIAGGMAHQLRNSLTGARMAVELHAMSCDQKMDDSLDVAIKQIESSEDYVRRLLLVASGRQDQDRPVMLRECWNDLQTSLTPLAKHLRVKLQWQMDRSIESAVVRDGPTLVAAMTNLIHNAMQAADQVKIELGRADENADESQVRFRISDNGAGVPDEVADELFEPFVTSKPEGMGLGLPVVRRAADYLGGSVRWRRDEQWTIFEMDVAVERTAGSE